MGVSEKGPVIDGCAGPGGWDLAARAFGIEPLGIEWDDAACATRAAAGLRTGRWLKAGTATTVAGDPRIFPPGHKINAEDIAAGRGGQQRSGAGWTDKRPAPTIVGTRRSKDGPLVGRQLPQGEGQNIGGHDWKDGPPEHRQGWPESRPSTSVMNDDRIAPAGHHDNHKAGAVRVTLEEALVLQDFPPDYPVQGSKTKRFEQVGNAIPPGLAYAALGVVVG